MPVRASLHQSSSAWHWAFRPPLRGAGLENLGEVSPALGVAEIILENVLGPGESPAASKRGKPHLQVDLGSGRNTR